LFGSVDSMREIVRRDPSFNAFRRHEAGPAGQEAYGVLLAERQVRHGLGMALNGETVQREVAESILFFREHRLRALATSVEGSLRLVRIGAFNLLLQTARERLARLKEGLPMAGSATAATPCDGAAASGGDAFLPYERRSVAAGPWTAGLSRLDEIDARVTQSGPAALRLDDYLEIVVEVLAHPQCYLAQQRFAAEVDRMGRLVERAAAGSADAERVALWEFVRPQQPQPIAAIMVRLKPAEFAGDHRADGAARFVL
jgi:hypothetical protein